MKCCIDEVLKEKKKLFTKIVLMQCCTLLIANILMGCSNDNSEQQRSQDTEHDVVTSEEGVLENMSNTIEEDDTVYILTRETSYYEGKKSSVIYYTYDEQGRLIQIDRDIDPVDLEETYDEETGTYRFTTTVDGIINQSAIFEYDDNGNAVQCVEFYKDEATGYVSEFSWQAGKLISEELFLDEESITDSEESRIVYTYDSEDKVTSFTLSKDGEEIPVFITYNVNGKVEEIYAKSEDTDQEVVVKYDYDTEGNLIPDEEENVEFQFDEYGNIISIQKENGKRIEYEYQKVESSDNCIWDGNDIALLCQHQYTGYYIFLIPGGNHANHIFDWLGR